MDRFVAMLWNDADRARRWKVNEWSEALQRQSPRWTKVLDAPGLRVFSFAHRGDAPIVTRMQGTEGVVLGLLFERGHEKRGRVRNLDETGARRVVDTGGELLIRDYWGNYVALWRDAGSWKTTVLRDPCGAVPCFMTNVRGIELLFSFADDVARLPGVEFSIDWTYLQAFIVHNYFITKYTGFNEVSELLGGERLEWTPEGKACSFLWSSAKVAAQPNFQRFEDAAAELRETGEACFAALGKEYRNIVVSVSGGLDSSIMVNLLRRVSDARITGLHFLGIGYEQYEVKLARLAAARAGVELIEAAQDPAKDDVRRILAAPLLARPKVQSLAVLVDDISVQTAERVGADCFMIGQGGDNLFLTRGSARHTVVDYMVLRGLGRDFWRIAYDAAMLQQCSILKAMGDAMAGLLFQRKWRPFEHLEKPEYVKLRPMPPDAFDKIPEEYKTHPWFADAARLPRNKANQVTNIIALYNYYLHHDRGVTRDVRFPLFSQPLAEFALRTPTYTLVHEGLDRALERRAFADLIPEEITRRTGKGRVDHYLLQVMQRNFSFYRDLIMDGEIIRQGWLDRAKIERMLSPDYVVHGRGAFSMYLLVSVEAWLETWRRQGARAAA